MALDSENEALIVRYLLNELPAAERRLFERRYFLDDRLFESMQDIETQLIRDFLHGDLSPGQSRSFQEQYLQSPELSEKVGTARLLLQAATAEKLVLHDTIRDKVTNFFRVRAVVLGFVASLAAVALVIAVWIVRDNQRFGPKISSAPQSRPSPVKISPPQAEAPQESAKLPPGESKAAPLAFVLSPGVMRGDSGRPQRIVIPAKGVDHVQLNLNFNPIEHHKGYRLIVSSVNGNEVSSRDLPGDKLAIDLPATKLPEGDYTIIVKGRSAPAGFEDLESFYFHVARR